MQQRTGYNPYRQLSNDTVNNFGIERNDSFFNNRLFNLSLFGKNYKENFIKNAKGIHKDENLRISDSQGNNYSLFSRKVHAFMKDKENIAMLSHDYVMKLPILQEYAVKGDISEYVSKMANELICYEDKMFCKLKPLPTHYPKQLIERVNTIFENIYTYGNFDDGTSAWDLARDWLVEGYICREIVYDSKGKNIIGFQKLDPLSVMPIIDENTGLKIWIQHPNDEINRRVLIDAEIIYISYSGSSNYMETSYVEPLIKPYNELKSIERSRILFNLINATMHKKFIIPTHGLSPSDAEQEILDLISDYKDNITFDETTGVTYIDGQKDLPYSKEYWLPDGVDGSPQIDIMDPAGHDLNENSMLIWFKNQLKQASKFPLSRLDNTIGGGNIFMGNQDLTHDDYNFQQYINRLKTLFKQIILKPLLLQVLIEFPEYENNSKFLNDIDIIYIGNSQLVKAQKLANLQAQSEIASTLQNNLKREDDKPLLHWKTISKYIMEFDPEMMKENEKNWKESEGKVTPGDGDGGGGDFGSDDFGGDDDFGGGDDFDIEDEGGLDDVGGDEIDEPIDDTPEE